MEKIKYPRTVHLPFSETVTKDDKRLENTEHFRGKIVVITEKMDGENTTIYNQGFHARSLDSKHRDYHSWLAQYSANFSYKIPEWFRVCGEYLFAKHSIEYNSLLSYFLGFSIWDRELCLNWEETKIWFELLGVVCVPELYIGVYTDEVAKEIAKEVIGNGGEGVVVRLVDAFTYDDFSISVAKYVRKNHVQTDKHWSLKEIEVNKLD